MTNLKKSVWLFNVHLLLLFFIFLCFEILRILFSVLNLICVDFFCYFYSYGV